jgi:predicted dehydrogenase
MRVGIIGAGAIAQVAHLPVLAKARGAQLVGICDFDRPKARALADRFGVADAFNDIEDLLALDDLDAIVITTPNHLHEPYALAALAANVHVLCERPLSLTSRGVERILAAAARADRTVAVANNHRFRSDVQMLERFLEGGELGKLSAIRAGHYTGQRATEGWRARRAEAGGGVLLEHGLPLLDLAAWLSGFPEPVRISAQMNRARGAGAVEDAMSVLIEAETGLTCMLDMRSTYVGEEDRWWFEVLATRGSARLAPLRVVKELNGRPTDVSPSGAAARESPFIQSYRAELAHFLAVLGGEAKYEPPADQVALMRVVEAIYRSAEEGKEIRP